MKMVCIICPNSCTLDINKENDKYVVVGAKCKRGEQFAVTEMTEPRRTLCTTVKTKFKDYPVISVKTNGEILKSNIKDLMGIINKIVVKNKVKIGDVIVKDINGTGVDLVSTTEIL
jgi:CxxC motif-containing protein